MLSQHRGSNKRPGVPAACLWNRWRSHRAGSRQAQFTAHTRTRGDRFSIRLRLSCPTIVTDAIDQRANRRLRNVHARGANPNRTSRPASSPPARSAWSRRLFQVARTGIDHAGAQTGLEATVACAGALSIGHSGSDLAHGARDSASSDPHHRQEPPGRSIRGSTKQGQRHPAAPASPRAGQFPRKPVTSSLNPCGTGIA